LATVPAPHKRPEQTRAPFILCCHSYSIETVRLSTGFRLLVMSLPTQCPLQQSTFSHWTLEIVMFSVAFFSRQMAFLTCRTHRFAFFYLLCKGCVTLGREEKRNWLFFIVVFLIGVFSAALKKKIPFSISFMQLRHTTRNRLSVASNVYE